MKNFTYFVCLMAIFTLSLTSCSKDSVEEMDSANLNAKVPPVAYSSFELQVLDLVNNYRATQNLPELEFLDESSVLAESHNEHMILNDEVCHDDFGARYQTLVHDVHAKAVSENVAYGYSSAEAVVNAWIKSEGHRENMLGDHTHFGIAISAGSDGKYYFTNIFVRK